MTSPRSTDLPKLRRCELRSDGANPVIVTFYNDADVDALKAAAEALRVERDAMAAAVRDADNLIRNAYGDDCAWRAQHAASIKAAEGGEQMTAHRRGRMNNE